MAIQLLALPSFAAVSDNRNPAEPALPSSATLPGRRGPAEPSWRVIENAPYRIIPGHPPLKATGETLEELGFKSIEKLLSGIEKRIASNSIVISPDGRQVVSGSKDNSVKIWDLETKRLINTLKGHSDDVNSVALSPKGDLIVSGSEDKSVKIWDLKNKKRLHSFEGHSGAVKSVAISPDGHIIVSGSNDKSIKIWDRKAKALLHSFGEDTSKEIWSIAFSPDGRFIASGSINNSIKLWDLENNTLHHTFRGHSGMVGSIAFSPDGRFIASGSANHSIILWDVETGKLLHSFEDHIDRSRSDWERPDEWDMVGRGASVAFSPDGRFIASGSTDNSVKLWNIENKTLSHVFKSVPDRGSDNAWEIPDWISSVAFSPDGRFIASGSTNNSVKLWNIENKTLSHAFEGGQDRGRDDAWEVPDWISSVAFSPDGRFIASGSTDNSVKLWNIENKTLSRTFKGSPDRNSDDGRGEPIWGASVAFSPDGRFIAAGWNDNSVKLWEIENNTLRYASKDGDDGWGESYWGASVAFSPDGRFIASGSPDNSIKLWDIEDKSHRYPFRGHSATVASVAFSPDGRFIASGSHDNTIILWDWPSKTLLHAFEGHSDKVASVAFSPDGRFIVSGSSDNSVKLWDIENKKLKHSFEDHSGAVSSAAFSPDGRFIVSGSNDKSVKLWDIKNKKKPLYSFEGHQDTVSSVAFSPDSRFIVSASNDKYLRIYDIEAKMLRYALGGSTGFVISVAFSSDGSRIASSTWDKSIKLWDWKSKKLLHSLEGSSDRVSRVAFSSDGRFIVSGSNDKSVKLWDIKNKKLLHSLEGSSDYVFGVAFSHDNKLIASGSMDQSVKLWDIKNKKLLYSFTGHSQDVPSVAFSPDGKFIASGSWDKSIKLWDIEARELRHSFEGHSDAVASVSFRPEGKQLIVSGSLDNTIKLWDVKTGEVWHTFEDHSDDVWSVAFSLDGRYIVSGSLDKSVKLWDIEAKELRHSFEGHSDGVLSVAFSPDGRYIASGSLDGTVKLWDIEREEPLATFVSGPHESWLAIDQQDRVFRGDDGTFLKKPSGEEGNWQPVPATPSGQQDSLSIEKLDPSAIKIQPGESQELRVQVKNTGNRPAFWLRLKPSVSKDKALRLDPPDTLLEGKGAQAWKPTRIARLDPGETISLFARITPNLKLPASFVKDGNRLLEIAVVSANGTEVRQTIEVNFQMPRLVFRRSMRNPFTKTLKLHLDNKGSASLKNISLTIYGFKHNKDGPPTKKELSQWSLEALDPAGTNELELELNDVDPSRLALQGSTTDLPIFSWELPSPKIKWAGLFLFLTLLPSLAIVLIALFYLRRYRHPLVVQLSANATALLRLPTEQLGDARIRLTKTNRLKATLAEAEVTAQTLSSAVAFVEKKTPEERAQWLADRLGASVEAVQPSLWELHLLDTFPLNLDRCLLSFPSAEAAPMDVYTQLRAIPQTRMRATILIGPDSAYQRKLREKTSDRTNKLVAPRGSELTELLLSPEPDKVLARILADQLTLAQLSPYQLGGGVNRETVFFGRQDIIAHVMNRDPANYLVVSGRQLGKSSLLKALNRRYREHPEVTCHYLALASESLLPRLAAELKLPRDAGLEGIAAHVADSDKRFLFLIDEADKFVRRERETDYPVLDALRRMSEEGHANFILAGFWELYEHAVLDYQSPLKNFAEIIQLGELEAAACRQLAIQPMQNMRLEYADPDLVEQLLQQTGQRANLMAIACHQILFQLKPDQRVIEAEDVRNALSSDKTLNALRGWDAMTDDAETCRMDRIVVYATVERGRVELADLAAILQDSGLPFDAHQIDRSLARLELGFVLAKDADGHFFYRVPLFREMVLKDDPQVRLKMELGARR